MKELLENNALKQVAGGLSVGIGVGGTVTTPPPSPEPEPPALSLQLGIGGTIDPGADGGSWG